MKKFGVLILSVLMIITYWLMPTAYGAVTNTDISIVSYSQDNHDVYEGQEVNFRFQLRNVTADTLDDVSIFVDNSSAFYVASGSDSLLMLGSIGGGSYFPEQSFRLVYKGTGNQLTLVVKYRKGSAVDYTEATQTFYLDTIPIGSSGGGDPTPDTSVMAVLGIAPEFTAPTGIAGNKMTITLPLRNNTSIAALNVTVSTKLDNDSKSPFVIDSPIIKQTVDRIDPKTTKYVTFELNVDKFAAAGTYPLVFTYQFTNIYGRPNSATGDSETIYIKIQNPNTLPKLTVTNITRSPLVVSPGKMAAVGFELKNVGSLSAKSITAKIVSGLDVNGFIMANAATEKYLETIEGTQKAKVDFLLLASNKIKSGNYEFDLEIKYRDEKNNEYKENIKFYLEAENQVSNKRPTLVLTNLQQPEGPVKPGEDFTVSFDLENVGTSDAGNIKITLSPDNSAIISKSLNIKTIDAIGEKGSKTVSFTLSATSEAATKNYPIALNIEYEGSDAGETTKYTVSRYIGVYVEKPKAEIPSIVIDRIGAPDAGVKPGDDFTVSFDLINQGMGEARNIKVTINSGNELINKSQSPLMINSIAAGEMKSLSFSMFAAEEASEKNYPITVSVEYGDAESGSTQAKYTATQYIGVYVEGKESSEGTRTVPKLIIDQYTLGEGEDSVKAGETFTLHYSLLNTSRQEPVRNLKITVSSDDGTFITEGSNTYFVEEIGCQKKVDLEVVLTSKPDATPKSYPLSLSFEYEDSRGGVSTPSGGVGSYTAKETISIPVRQDPRLVAGEINVMPEVFVGQQAPIYLDFYNMGKTTLYNLMVKIEGDFGQVQSYYVGNFEPGRSDYYDTAVMPQKAGQIKGNVLFTFEDAAGNPTEVRKEFTMNVMEMARPVDMPMDGGMIGKDGMPIGKNGMPIGMGPEAAGGKFKLIPVIAAGAGLVIAVLVIIIVKKKRAKRKEMMLDELS